MRRKKKNSATDRPNQQTQPTARFIDCTMGCLKNMPSACAGHTTPVHRSEHPGMAGIHGPERAGNLGVCARLR